MFSLSPAGRHNLEAICVELERATRHYPPLFHQQLKPWSAKGEVSITERQWLAFIENQGDCLSDETWCDWHGPTDDYIGIWHGSPDGLTEFCDLIESLAMILCREDFSDVDSYVLPIEFESVHEWLATLHKWAMKFSLPLLRGFVEVWNGDDNDAAEFIRLTQTWGGVGDVSYPLHPLVFNLQYNVYSSTRAALEALLMPDFVIATNEPWPLSSAMTAGKDKRKLQSSLNTADVKDDKDRQHTVTHRPDAHRIVQTPGQWCVIPAGSETPFVPIKQTGLIRVAMLIDRSPSVFTPLELSRFTGASSLGAGIGRHAIQSEDGSVSAISKPQPQDNRQQREDAENELRELAEERAKAKRSGDNATLDRVNQQIRAVSETFHVTKDYKVKPQRAFRDEGWKKAQDTVSKTIRQFWDELDDKGWSPLRAELEKQIKLPTLSFSPEDGFVPWEVCRIT